MIFKKVEGEILREKKAVCLKIEYLILQNLSLQRTIDMPYCTIFDPHFWQTRAKIHIRIIFKISSHCFFCCNIKR